MIPTNPPSEDTDDTPPPRGSVDRLRPPHLAGFIAKHARQVTEAQSAHPAPGLSSSSATATRSEVGLDYLPSTSEVRPRLRRPDPSLRAIRAASTIDERLEDFHPEKDSIAESSPRWSVYENDAPARPMKGSMRDQARRDREPG